MGSANPPKGPNWIYPILGVHFSSSSSLIHDPVQQRNICLEEYGSRVVGICGSCIDGIAGKAGEVSGLSDTPPKVAARRVSALARGESVQESSVSSIGVGRAIMVVNRAGRRIRR